jgi:hypothetical protein
VVKRATEGRIIYIPRRVPTPETELNTLAAVYRLVLNSRKENAAGVTSTNDDDAKKGSLKHDNRTKTRIP